MSNFVERSLGDVLLKDVDRFPVVTLTGPRQSGKSTLLKKLFSDWQYVNLEDPGLLEFAQSDVKGFLSTYPSRTIIDEIQRCPQILSHIQSVVDADRFTGRYVLTGSHNLLLLEQVSQSLAGRTSIRNLFPLSYAELSAAGRSSSDLNENLLLGGYPIVNVTSEILTDWLDSYMLTYVERDVRLIRNVSDLSQFRRFLRVIAGRVGQLVDLSGIGNDLGISHNTVRDWIGVLEAGFIAFRLTPYFNNFSKRLIKSPKIYFYDTGLLCRLLDIRSAGDLIYHPFRGAIFENWCVTEALKAFANKGKSPELFFWRDQQIEIDLLLGLGANSMIAIECKSGQTVASDAFSPIVKLQSFAKGYQVQGRVVYGGADSQQRSSGTLQSWQEYGRTIASSI